MIFEPYGSLQQSGHFFQNGVITIPKSTKRERLMENYEVTFSRLPLSSRINPGTDVLILKIFSPKKSEKKLALFDSKQS
jgi:hypothetical protein